MWKFLLIVIVFFIILSNLSADGYPTDVRIYKSKITLNTGLEIIGHVGPFPFYTMPELENYRFQSAKKDSEILPLILDNYAQDIEWGHNSLFIYTKLADWNNWYFSITGESCSVNFEDVNSIIALEDIVYNDDSGIYLNYASVLTQEEVDVLNKGVVCFLETYFAEHYVQINLLSTNPAYNTDDLYLYTCLLNDGRNKMQTNLNLFILREYEYPDGIVQDYIYENQHHKSDTISFGLIKYSKFWKRISKLAKHSRIISPDEKTATVDTLLALSKQCKLIAKELRRKSAQELRSMSSESKEQLYDLLVDCMYPRLYFRNNLSDYQLESYLLEKGILIVSSAEDP